MGNKSTPLPEQHIQEQMIVEDQPAGASANFGDFSIHTDSDQALIDSLLIIGGVAITLGLIWLTVVKIRNRKKK